MLDAPFGQPEFLMASRPMLASAGYTASTSQLSKP